MIILATKTKVAKKWVNMILQIAFVVTYEKILVYIQHISLNRKYISQRYIHDVIASKLINCIGIHVNIMSTKIVLSRRGQANAVVKDSIR
jgi:hypothetical protein